MNIKNFVVPLMFGFMVIASLVEKGIAMDRQDVYPPEHDHLVKGYIALSLTQFNGPLDEFQKIVHQNRQHQMPIDEQKAQSCKLWGKLHAQIQSWELIPQDDDIPEGTRADQRALVNMVRLCSQFTMDQLRKAPSHQSATLVNQGIAGLKAVLAGARELAPSLYERGMYHWALQNAADDAE